MSWDVEKSFFLTACLQLLIAWSQKLVKASLVGCVTCEPFFVWRSPSRWHGWRGRSAAISGATGRNRREHGAAAEWPFCSGLQNSAQVLAWLVSSAPSIYGRARDIALAPQPRQQIRSVRLPLFVAHADLAGAAWRPPAVGNPRTQPHQQPRTHRGLGHQHFHPITPFGQPLRQMRVAPGAEVAA